jgi:putative DNA-binding protein
MNAQQAPTLRELQQRMAGLIVDPERFNTDADALAALFAVSDHCDAVARLRVYANGYPARLEEALKETFPAVEHVVGPGAFVALAHRFAAAFPLHSYNLNDAGEQLPEFLRSDPLTASLPFLPDMARLEWYVSKAFHATDEPTVDPAPLAQWSLDDWERAVLRFQPWVAVVESDWPIREIWECRATPVEEIDVDLHNRRDQVLVRRAGFAVICESLDAAEAYALRLLLDGRRLGGVMATLTANGEDPAAVSAWFSRWAALRMIVSVSPCDQ